MASSSTTKQSSRVYTRKEVEQLQQSYITLLDRRIRAMMKKTKNTLPKDSAGLSEEYLHILEKELGNFEQLMTSHLSLLTNSRMKNDGDPPVSIKKKDMMSMTKVKQCIDDL